MKTWDVWVQRVQRCNGCSVSCAKNASHCGLKIRYPAIEAEDDRAASVAALNLALLDHPNDRDHIGVYVWEVWEVQGEGTK